MTDGGWVRTAVIVPVVGSAAGVLMMLPAAIGRWWPGETWIGGMLKYQLFGVGVAAIVLAVSYALSPAGFRTYLRAGDRDAAVEAVPWIALRPKPGQTWRHVGTSFAIVITTVTGVVIYLSLIRGRTVDGGALLRVAPILVALAVANSFTEELIFRFSLVAVLSSATSRSVVLVLGAGIFGVAHYFGTPGGVAGVLMASFLGWLLTKSILETRGVFWAWFIHFLQDIVVFVGVWISQA